MRRPKLLIGAVVLLFAIGLSAVVPAAAQQLLGAVFGSLGLAVLFAYYLKTWAEVGKDPPKGTVVVRYGPPAELSPAAVRFLTRMGFDHKAFVVTLISLATRHYLSIERAGEVYVLKRESTDQSTLAPEEKAVALKLFEDRDTLELDDNNRWYVNRAIERLQESLTRRLGKEYFSANSPFMKSGLLLSVAVLFFGCLPWGPGLIVISAFLLIWNLFVAFTVYLALAAWIGFWRSIKARKLESPTAGLTFTAVAAPLVWVDWFFVSLIAPQTPTWFLGLVAAVFFLNVVFYFLLKAPTPVGRQLLDQIEGFKQFLLAVEQTRLDRLNPPEKTPELYEKYLPYAMALDLEQAWGEQFTFVLSSASFHAATEAGGYSPSWYIGGSWREFDAAGFSTALFVSLMRTVENLSGGRRSRA